MLLFGVERFAPRVPGGLLALVAGIVVSAGLGPVHQGVTPNLVAVSSSPTSFLAVVFASSDLAHDALADIRRWGSDREVALRDSAVVSRTPRGDIDLDQSREVSAGDALVGVGTAGLVAGLLLGLPIGGALLGLAGGAALGLRDTGIPDSRMRKLGDQLQSGQALLCILVDEDARAPLRDALGHYGTALEVELPSDPEP